MASLTTCGGILLDADQFNVTEDKVIHITGGSGGEVTSVNGKTGNVSLGAADVEAEPTGTTEAHNGNNAAHTDIREKIEALTQENATLNTGIQNIIKGDYIGTDSQFVNVVKDTSGVKININELGAIANATGAEDVVTQFNLLLNELRTMGVLAE